MQFHAFHIQNLFSLQNLQVIMLCNEHANMPAYPNPKCTQNKTILEEKQLITECNCFLHSLLETC